MPPLQTISLCEWHLNGFCCRSKFVSTSITERIASITSKNCRQLPKESKTFVFNLFKISDSEKVDKTDKLN